MPHSYVIDSARQRHILDGDATGGGHRAGTGHGKSEFPQSWTDQQILTAILDIAHDIKLTPTRVRSGRLKIVGLRGGIRITVIADPANWAIITGYPS